MKHQKLLMWSRAVLVMVALLGLLGCGFAAPGSQTTDEFTTSSQSADHSTVTLHLDIPHEKLSMQPAEDLPAGVIDVQLPLYPNAKASNQPFPMANKSAPRTPYLKAASAEFVLPISEAEAKAWYQDHMSAAGFTQQITGQGGNSQTGVNEETIFFGFVSTKNPALHVNVSYQQVKPDQTLLMYFAYQVVQPQRSVDSQLPTDMSKVEIHYHPADRSKAIVQKTITDPAVLTQLVIMINSLPLDVSGPRSCVLDFGQGATLHFVETKGQTFDVTLRAACGNVSINQGRALTDVHDSVWNTVTALMQKS